MRTTQRVLGSRPDPFSVITTRQLWTDPHVSAQMLRYHLDPAVDLASRRPAAIDAAVAWIARRFSVGPGTAVLDLGCGPGLYAIRLARTGADVTGVDFSAGSLAHARAAAARDGLSIEYVEADYLEWQPTTAFDLVMMIFCDYCALGPDERLRLLRSVRSWLAPDGAFLFDVVAVPYLATRTDGVQRDEHPDGGFWAGGPYAEVHETLVYPAERVVLDRYDIVEPGRSRTLWNWLQAFDPESLAVELGAAGLAVSEVLGDVAGSPYARDGLEFAVVARRVS